MAPLADGAALPSRRGYAGEDEGWRALLVLSHLLLVPSLARAWRARHELPFLLFALASCFCASTAYHACYSYGACAFADRRLHHVLDLHFSGMLLPVTLATFLWHRRCPPAGAGPPGRERTLLTYARPRWVDPLLLALYVADAGVHVARGLDASSPRAALVAGSALVACAHVGEALRWGLRVRVGLLLLIVALVGPAFAAFHVDTAAMHDLWHVLSFAGVAAYLWWGPVLTAADGRAVTFGDEAAG